MNKGKRNLIILGIFVLFLLFINYKFNNILVRGYNYAQKLPKLLIVCISIIAIIAPTLISTENISFFEYFIPEGILKKFKKPKENNVDIIKEIEKSNKQTKEINKIKPTQRKVSDKIKKYVAARQGWKCFKCKNTLDATYECDHIIPLYKGGTNQPNNLQALCRNCHGQKTLEDGINM